jgi:hypothetical protein
MEAVVELEQAIFENTQQAVHVAFLIMAQPATQDAPLRKALIRIMESINLVDGRQRHWLDQLRGTSGGSVNFGGLSPGDIRAQCAMITQAVKKLPDMERWVLQAKYGEVEAEDVEIEESMAAAALLREVERVDVIRVRLEHLRTDLHEAKAKYQTASPGSKEHSANLYNELREAVRETSATLTFAERKQRTAQAAADRLRCSAALDNGPPDKLRTRRRYVFSAERIEAIQGLSGWLAPMFPQIKLLAIDCMLGRMFASHKKIDISVRDLAAQFGGSHMVYFRASWKMKNHIRQLEDLAIARLRPIFEEHGVTCVK